MGKMLKWILIGGLVIGAWMFLVPPSIKCKVPVIGGNCQDLQKLDQMVQKTTGYDFNENNPPILEIPNLFRGIQEGLPRQSNFARAQMLRGIY